MLTRLLSSQYIHLKQHLQYLPQNQQYLPQNRPKFNFTNRTCFTLSNQTSCTFTDRTTISAFCWCIVIFISTNAYLPNPLLPLAHSVLTSPVNTCPVCSPLVIQPGLVSSPIHQRVVSHSLLNVALYPNSLSWRKMQQRSKRPLEKFLRIHNLTAIFCSTRRPIQVSHQKLLTLI